MPVSVYVLVNVHLSYTFHILAGGENSRISLVNLISAPKYDVTKQGRNEPAQNSFLGMELHMFWTYGGEELERNKDDIENNISLFFYC